MSLSAGCPRCSSAVEEPRPGTWVCPDHGETPPLWRPAEVSYDSFAEHLRASGTFPTYLPWPLSPGWLVADFAVVGADPAQARATMTGVSGTSELDGPVELVVVAEEPGTGLGARVAGTSYGDPGGDIGEGPPSFKVRIDSQVVPLWVVSTNLSVGEWDRSVVAGEADGRWLWLVLRPASAMLLLRDDWILRDVSRAGPELLELPFGGPATHW